MYGTFFSRTFSLFFFFYFPLQTTYHLSSSQESRRIQEKKYSPLRRKKKKWERDLSHWYAIDETFITGAKDERRCNYSPMKIVRGLVLECFKSSTLLSRPPPIVLPPSSFPSFLFFLLLLLLPARRLGTSCILHGRVFDENEGRKTQGYIHGNRMYLPFLRACINLPLGYSFFPSLDWSNIFSPTFARKYW